MEKLYTRAYDWLFNFGPRIIIALILVVVGFWLIKHVLKWIDRVMTRRTVDPSLRPFFISLLNIGLMILLVLTTMQILGLQLTIFAALAGAFGVAAGLALSGTLQNFTSGILILLLKPFEVGDIIIAQGQEGIVSYIRIFYTVVTSFDNRTIIIPNSKLSNEVIVNLSREGKRRLDIEMKLSFGIPFNEAYAVIKKTLNTRTDLLKEPTFTVGVSSIEPDGYKMMTNVWVEAHSFQKIRLELQESIVKDLIAAGLKLPGV